MLSCFHNPKQKLHISGIDGVCFSSHDSCGTSLLGLDAQYLLAQAYPKAINMLLRIHQCPPPQVEPLIFMVELRTKPSVSGADFLLKGYSCTRWYNILVHLNSLDINMQSLSGVIMSSCTCINVYAMQYQM